MQNERSPAGWLGSSLFWGMASDSGEWFLAAWRPARLRPCALRFAGGLGPDVSGLRRSGAARCLMESGTFRCPGVQVSLHPGAQKCRFVGDAAARFSGASAFRFPGFSARPPSPVSRSPPGSPAASEPPYAAVAIGLLPLALVVVLVIGLGRPEVRCRGDARHHVVPLCAQLADEPLAHLTLLCLLYTSDAADE